MELVNKTFLAANLGIGEIPGSERRMGILAAKGTFRILPNGQCEPDLDNPYPMFKEDEETPLGLLPRDDFPKEDNLDVIVLGNAYPPGGRPASRMTVSIQVGSIKRSLAIFGDRYWHNEKITEPLPFEKMPITYGNAHGGKVEVEIDDGSFVSVADARNQEGKGFAVEQMMPGINAQFKPPEGFPRFDKTRPLPNIEDPDQLISSPTDSPDPAYWATVPLSTAVHAYRSMGLGPEDLKNPHLLDEEKSITTTPTLYHRAHPGLDLDIEELEPNTEIVLKGLSPAGEIKILLPALEIWADILLKDKMVEKKLRADTIVILPEEMRFYMVYRYCFSYEYEIGAERTVRLAVRLADQPETRGTCHAGP